MMILITMLVEGIAINRQVHSHCTILAVDNDGLKNLFKLVSIAHTETFYRVPSIRRSDLTKLREGLIVGSGCIEW